MAMLPNFIVEQNAERAEAAFRQECADRAREYVLRVRARRAARQQSRLISFVCFTAVGTMVWVSWQLASLLAWLLNN